MSDENPPTSSSPGEPTPTPDEGVAPSEETAPQEPVAGETTPPLAAPVAEEPEATPSAAEEKKSGRGKLLAIIAAVVVVVLVLGGLGYFLFLKSDNHKLTTPSTAGSMKRDTAREKTLSTELNQAEQQFKTEG